MRIVIASPYLPWPLNTGGNAAVYSTLLCLAADHDFRLVCPVFDDEGVKNAAELQARLPRVEVRAVNCSLSRSAPERAARWCVRYGRRLLSPPPISKPTLPYPFSPLPERLVGALSDELSKGVDLFQVEYAEFMSLGAWLPKELPRLFVHLQIHFVYAQRFLDARGADCYARYISSVMQVQELAYLQNFDGVIVFSENDRETLMPYVRPEKLFTSPPPIPSDVSIAPDVSPRFDNRFVFVASEEHGPNRDGLEWLLAEIWPEIRRQLPSATLDVVGRWSKGGRATFSAPGINFTGFVPDLQAVLHGSIMLVPLRIGSGVRIKILTAMAQGVPTVSTTIGCEGLLVSDGRDILVRDEPHQIALAAIALAQDSNLRRRLALAARDAVSRHYSQQEVRRRRNEIYAALSQKAQSEYVVE